VAQVVQAHPGQPCARDVPGAVQRGEVRVGLLARHHLSALRRPCKPGQHVHSLRRQRHHPGTRLGVPEPQLARIQINLLPPKGQDFPVPTARQHQQPDGRRGQERKLSREAALICASSERAAGRAPIQRDAAYQRAEQSSGWI